MSCVIRVAVLIIMYSVLLPKITKGQIVNSTDKMQITIGQAMNSSDQVQITKPGQITNRSDSVQIAEGQASNGPERVKFTKSGLNCTIDESDDVDGYGTLTNCPIDATSDEIDTAGYCPPITPEETEGLAPDSAEILYTKLFRCYNQNVRPVHNISIPVEIYVKVILKSIEKLDMKTQREIARLVVELSWTDANLSWDKRLYRNVSRFTVGADKIWLPDVTVESLTGSFEFIKVSDIGKAVVDHRGTVTVWPSILANLGTEIVVSKYPFDTQNLTFIFGSWAYHSKEIIYTLEEAHPPLGSYQTNAEWLMLGYTSFIDQYSYGGVAFDRVGYTFTIQRRWLYYAMNVIGPVVLACVLNLLVFLLPAASGQRVTLAISIFLSLTLFLAQINDSLPKTSVGLSMFVVYLCLQLIGSVMTIASSVLIIYLSQRACATEKPHSSKVLEFFCRTVVPKQILKKYQSEPEDETTADADATETTAETEITTVTETTGMTGNNQGSTENRPFPFPFASGIKKAPRKNVMAMASEYINTSCLWMSVIWNIVLLIALAIFGSVA